MAPRIRLKTLKAWAAANLPACSTLRNVLLAESQVVEASALVGKVESWLILFRIDSGLYPMKGAARGESEGKR